jgi:1-acyl-sn-glycerol-3-phosphate acyltransferase
MGRFLSKLIFQWLLGWKVTVFVAPIQLQHVCIAIPHTSNWDFFLGVFSRSIHRVTHVKFVGKSSLFAFPFGFIFRWLGGYPVDRSNNNNYVQNVAQIFKDNPDFSVCIAPEGTRKYTKKLKTGFYYIAKTANVPIIFVTFDYGSKTVDFSEPFYLTDDFDADMSYIVNYFKGVKGLNYTFDMEYPWSN